MLQILISPVIDKLDDLRKRQMGSQKETMSTNRNLYRTVSIQALPNLSTSSTPILMQINTTDTATMTLTVKIEEYFMKMQKKLCSLLSQLQMSHKRSKFRHLESAITSGHNAPKTQTVVGRGQEGVAEVACGTVPLHNNDSLRQ